MLQIVINVFQILIALSYLVIPINKCCETSLLSSRPLLGGVREGEIPFSDRLDFTTILFTLLSQPNGRKQNIETSSLQMIADLSFQGSITNLIFYILLSGERAKSLFENLKRKYSKKKADLKKAKK